MMSVRQTLDRSSRNAISDSKDIHRHHVSDDTPPRHHNIELDSSTRINRSDPVVISPR
jgi:hypothetical protein